MIKILKPTRADIDKIMYDEWIHDRITDDITYKNPDVSVPYNEWFFLGGYLENKIIGLFVVHDDNRMHFMVLKNYRKYANKLLKKFLQEFNQDNYAIIPEAYKSVINFALKNGFKFCGFAGKYLKNGKEYKNLKLEYKVTKWDH